MPCPTRPSRWTAVRQIREIAPRNTWALAVLGGCLLGAHPAQANLLNSADFTLETAADPNNLMVGEDVIFRLRIDPPAGETSFDLAGAGGTLTYDQSLLGTPFDLTPGAAATDSASLTLTPFMTGDLDFQYFAVAPASNLTTAGVLFSFTFNPQAVGSGTLGFEPSSTFTDDGNSFNEQIQVNSIDYNINDSNSGGGPAVVPTPSAAVAGLALLGLSSLARRRRGV